MNRLKPNRRGPSVARSASRATTSIQSAWSAPEMNTFSPLRTYVPASVRFAVVPPHNFARDLTHARQQLQALGSEDRGGDGHGRQAPHSDGARLIGPRTVDVGRQ